jgi:hypothetical protein
MPPRPVTRIALLFLLLTFYVTRRLITVFARAFHGTLSWERWTQSLTAHPISLGFIFLPTHCVNVNTPYAGEWYLPRLSMSWGTCRIARLEHPRWILLGRQVLWCQCWSVPSRREEEQLGQWCSAVLFGMLSDCVLFACECSLPHGHYIHPPTHSRLYVCHPLLPNLLGSFVSPLTLQCPIHPLLTNSVSLLVSHSVGIWV